ncbi:hypothetical protein M1D47_26535 [Bacillus sp. R1-10]
MNNSKIRISETTDIIISITVQDFIVCATADHPKSAPFTCDGVMGPAIYYNTRTADMIGRQLNTYHGCNEPAQQYQRMSLELQWLHSPALAIYF